jgi:hypothetical protein
VYTWIGHPVHMTCNPVGKPKPKIRWYKDWNPLKANDRISVRESGKLLILTPEYVEDFGLYSCNASNSHGFAIIDSKILEAKTPGEPEVIVLETTAYSVTLNLKPPIDTGGLEITGYRCMP